MGNVVSHFIAPLKIHFKVPESAEDDPMAFFEDMRSDLSRFGDNTLKKAAATIRQTRDGTIYFPSVAECIRVCRDTEGAEVAKRILNDTKPQDDRSGDFHVRQANRLIRCELGESAAKEGWIARLWDYCREHGQIPIDKKEIEKMVSAHKVLEKEWEDLINSGKVMPFLLTARNAITSRRQRLSEIVRGAS